MADQFRHSFASKVADHSATQAFRSRRVVLPRPGNPGRQGPLSGHVVSEAVILVQQGRIKAVVAPSDFDASSVDRVWDYGDHVIMPGIVDLEVHFGETAEVPVEGFMAGTWAAAAGGVTTVLDHPITEREPIASAAALAAKRRAAEGKLHVDVGLVGLLSPGQVQAQVPALVEAGAMGLVGFLTPPAHHVPALSVDTDLEALRTVLTAESRGPEQRMVLCMINSTLTPPEELEVASPCRVMDQSRRESSSPLTLIPFRYSKQPPNDSGGSSSPEELTPMSPLDQSTWRVGGSTRHESSEEEEVPAQLPNIQYSTVKPSGSVDQPVLRAPGHVDLIITHNLQGDQDDQDELHPAVQANSPPTRVPSHSPHSMPDPSSQSYPQHSGLSSSAEPSHSMPSPPTSVPAPFSHRRPSLSNRKASRDEIQETVILAPSSVVRELGVYECQSVEAGYPLSSASPSSSSRASRLHPSVAPEAEVGSGGRTGSGASDGRRSIRWQTAWDREASSPKLRSDLPTSIKRHLLQAELDGYRYLHTRHRPTKSSPPALSQEALSPDMFQFSDEEDKGLTTSLPNRPLEIRRVHSLETALGGDGRPSPGPRRGSSDGSMAANSAATLVPITSPPTSYSPPHDHSFATWRGGKPVRRRSYSGSVAIMKDSRVTQTGTTPVSAAGSPTNAWASDSSPPLPSDLAERQPPTSLGPAAASISGGGSIGAVGPPDLQLGMERSRSPPTLLNLPVPAAAGGSGGETAAAVGAGFPRRMSLLERRKLALGEKQRQPTRASASERSKPFKSMSISIYKESDKLTRKAMREEYFLYVGEHNSGNEVRGLRAIVQLVIKGQSLDKARTRRRLTERQSSISPPASPRQQPREQLHTEHHRSPPDQPSSGPLQPPSHQVPFLHALSISTYQASMLIRGESAGGVSASLVDAGAAAPEGSGGTEHGSMDSSPQQPSFTASASVMCLTHSADQVPVGNTWFKTQPPIRHETHQQALWDSLRDGVVQSVCSGHREVPDSSKRKTKGDFLRSSTGSPTLQTLLPALWTEASSREFSVCDLADWLCAGPACAAGLKVRVCAPERNRYGVQRVRHTLSLAHNDLDWAHGFMRVRISLQGIKGSIIVGADADLVMFKPEEEFSLTRKMLVSQSKESVWLGSTLKGRVHATFLRGVQVFAEGNLAPALTLSGAILTPRPCT